MKKKLIIFAFVASGFLLSFVFSIVPGIASKNQCPFSSHFDTNPDDFVLRFYGWVFYKGNRPDTEDLIPVADCFEKSLYDNFLIVMKARDGIDVYDNIDDEEFFDRGPVMFMDGNAGHYGFRVVNDPVGSPDMVDVSVMSYHLAGEFGEFTVSLLKNGDSWRITNIVNKDNGWNLKDFMKESADFFRSKLN